MNKNRILSILFENVKYTNEQREILDELERAKLEWEIASEYFKQVNEPELIDYAIYKEETAKAKFMHYLSKAKEKNIEIDYKYCLNRFSS